MIFKGKKMKYKNCIIFKSYDNLTQKNCYAISVAVLGWQSYCQNVPTLIGAKRVISRILKKRG